MKPPPSPRALTALVAAAGLVLALLVAGLLKAVASGAGYLQRHKKASER